MLPPGIADATKRLLVVARSDTGQGRRVANFLLAWWNADSLGGFDLSDLFALDEALALDTAAIFSWLATQPNAVYPEELWPEIDLVIQQWRPAIWRASGRS
jgi:hypothetical protein